MPGPTGVTGPQGPRGDPGELVRTLCSFAVAQVLFAPPADPPALPHLRAPQGDQVSVELMECQVLLETSCSYR